MIPRLRVFIGTSGTVLWFDPEETALDCSNCQQAESADSNEQNRPFVPYLRSFTYRWSDEPL